LRVIEARVETPQGEKFSGRQKISPLVHRRPSDKEPNVNKHQQQDVWVYQRP